MPMVTTILLCFYVFDFFRFPYVSEIMQFFSFKRARQKCPYSYNPHQLSFLRDALGVQSLFSTTALIEGCVILCHLLLHLWPLWSVINLWLPQGCGSSDHLASLTENKIKLSMTSLQAEYQCPQHGRNILSCPTVVLFPLGLHLLPSLTPTSSRSLNAPGHLQAT